MRDRSDAAADPDDERGAFDWLEHVAPVVDPRVWTHGRVVRLLEKSPALATETVWLELDDRGPGWNVELPDGLVLEEHAFRDEPVDGPVLLSSRILGAVEDADRLLALHVGNWERPSDVWIRDPLPAVDARGVPRMPDDVFWSWIDRLDGSSSMAAINRMARGLAAESDEDILGFAQAAGWRMWQLDLPDLDRIWHDDDGVAHAPALLTEHQRGAAIAGGRERFEGVVADPRSVQWSWVRDHSFFVPVIASVAWGRKHRVDAGIRTDWRGDEGSAQEHWRAEGVRYGPVPHIPDPAFTAWSESEGQRWEELWMKSIGRHFDSRLLRRWFTARCFVQTAAHVHEVLMYVHVEDRLEGVTGARLAEPDGREVLDAYVDAERQAALEALSSAHEEVATRLGGRPVGPVQTFDPHTGYPRTAVVFRIRRRTRASVDDYLSRYWPGRDAPPPA